MFAALQGLGLDRWKMSANADDYYYSVVHAKHPGLYAGIGGYHIIDGVPEPRTSTQQGVARNPNLNAARSCTNCGHCIIILISGTKYLFCALARYKRKADNTTRVISFCRYIWAP